jgi:hypothetical protein
MLSDIFHFGVEFLKSNQRFARNLSCQLDISVLGHENSYDEVFAVGQVDQVLVIVEVDYCKLRVCLGLS